MEELYNIIKQLQGISSTNAKLQILKDNIQSVFLADYLNIVYNPRINYYFTGLKDYTRSPFFQYDNRDFTASELKSLLNELSSRELSGNAAKQCVSQFYDQLNDRSRELVNYIFLRDIRAGVSVTTINKAFPGLIPTVPYMRCDLLSNVKTDSWPWERGIYVQTKYDGMFAYLQTGEAPALFSRAGSPFPVNQFKKLITDTTESIGPNMVAMGELLVYKNGELCKREIGNGILNSVLQDGVLPEDCEVVMVAWDMVTLEEYNTKESKTPYSTRLKNLESETNAYTERAKADYTIGYTSFLVTEYEVVNSLKEAMYKYSKLVKDGQEGAIIKHPEMPWKNTTSKQQIKLKMEVTVDLKLVGFNEGKGKNAATFGSSILQTSCGELEVGVSGYTDSMRLWIHENGDELLENETIFAVVGNALMPPSEDGKKWSIFLPRFSEIRYDKKTADSLESVIQQFENALKVK